jgi:hypothetical protein
MLVIAPASDISRLDWLTNAEGEARTDATERADELAEAAPTDDVESRVGDSTWSASVGSSRRQSISDAPRSIWSRTLTSCSGTGMRS